MTLRATNSMPLLSLRRWRLPATMTHTLLAARAPDLPPDQLTIPREPCYNATLRPRLTSIISANACLPAPPLRGRRTRNPHSAR
jgi:hypothetical protein